ncbi:hypothetical protein ZIOFF_061659 [Zingiber officinale]|uniref:Endoplasmic reticulum vesicle transporter C-terminal domain-containing protein n=1 Tax=Zingiber officinale TaxID=94328 RepID=A0A8J5F4B4_ZINOF|nr:hypothetical protein ZIOFF_061659 [Zingiber officinale]
MSHKINKLSFGKEFPGVINPLYSECTQLTSGMYQYFIIVVPTIYTDIRGRKIYSNQVSKLWISLFPINYVLFHFSVTEHFRNADAYLKLPAGVYFFYDFSPIKGKNDLMCHIYRRKCIAAAPFAIIGGVFTVSRIIDAFIYHGHGAIKKKMELGKHS